MFARQRIERTSFFVGLAARDVGNQPFERLAFLEYGQGAIFQGDYFGRAVAILFRHALAVAVGPDF